MTDHYQVKFNRDGKTFYGVVQNFSDAAEDAAKRGELIVEDAVLPTAYRVKESDVTDIEMEMGRLDMATHRWLDQDEYHTYVQDELEKAENLSDSLGDGVKAGKLFGTHVGDGTAWYVVTKVNKKTCKVEWRGFCPDRWVDQWLGYTKTVPIADIERMVGRASTVKSIFGMV